MLAQDLPSCICGRNTYYEGGGGSFSPSGYTSQWTCASCHRYVVNCGARGFDALLFDGGMDPKATELFTYLNDTLIPFWRAERAAFEHAGEESQEQNLEYLSPIPPRLPISLALFLRRRGNVKVWERIDATRSAKVDMPLDPIGVRHREQWAKLHEQMQRSFFPSISIVPAELKNRYYDDRLNNEPWYTFSMAGVVFIYGPRKRVISLEVTVPQGFDATHLEAVARKDDVTFNANGVAETGLSKATHVLVHAWTNDKFIEYFKLIVQGLQP